MANVNAQAASAAGHVAAFVEPLPIVPVKQPLPNGADSLSPYPTKAPNNAGGEGRTRTHQAFTTYPSKFMWPPARVFEIRQSEARVRVHPDLPEQRLWGFDGMVPGPTYHAMYGEQILVRNRNELPPDDPSVLAGEIAVLQIFADLSSLYRNRRGADLVLAGDETEEIDPTGEEARNPQEYLYAYLRSRDAAAEGLPESFRVRLRRALGHYGVTELELGGERTETKLHSAELHSALYRMFLAHTVGPAARYRCCSELLQCGLRNPDSLPAAHREYYLRPSTSSAGHPAVLPRRQAGWPGRSATTVRRAADRRRAGSAGGRVRDELERWTRSRPAERRPVDAIVAAGEPILGVFGPRHHDVMLEVMTRRYYRIRTLEDLRVAEQHGRPVLTTGYTDAGRRYLVIATTVHTDGALGAADPIAAQGELRRLIARLPGDYAVLLDLYVRRGAGPPGAVRRRR